jgi:two-component system alkaline phosphatase synthesis response regulator PhoP
MWRIKMSDKKVLVVDDEIHIVQVVAIKLRNNGFAVVTAENGQDAFNLACNETPDVIVTDFQMPGMTGVELIENLRNRPATADVPVIMLTARGFAIDDEQKQNLKISVCLSKPFSPREVLQCVEDVLKQKVSA